MPVIRLAGSGGGFFQQAGQAAGAFDQATADSRRQQHVRERIAQQRLQAQQQQGLQAQQQDFQNQATTRGLDIREKSIDAQRTRYQMRDAVKQSNGVPITGAGTIQMVTRLSELDRGAYEQLAPQLQAMAGFDENNPASPEALDALENLPDIYAAIAPAYAQAVKQADVAAVQNGFEETVSSYITDPKTLEQDREWAEWHQGLADGLARAQRSTGGASMAMMAPLYQAAKVEGARIATVKRDRDKYLSKYDEMVQSGKYDEDDVQSAQLRMAEMGRSSNPRQTFVEAAVRLDPEFRLAHEMGMRSGTAQGMTQAATAQVLREQARAQQNFDSEFASQQAQPASGGVQGTMDAMRADLNKPPTQINVDAAPAARALGLDDTARREIREELKASEVDPDDEEGVRRFIQGKLRRDKMRQGIYRDEYTQKRYTGTPQ